MLDVRDVYGDVKTHFVDPIPRPTLTGLKRSTRSEGEINEKNPLLHSFPVPPPHTSSPPPPPPPPPARRTFAETVEFSHLVLAVDTTHRRTNPAVSSDGHEDESEQLSTAQ
ncbi:hypothetical protein GBAR_LOCUS23081 [Geodia barretti]|nr:hypothetical protein GBAR_LOCUS23081 [Geodia barretti]